MHRDPFFQIIRRVVLLLGPLALSAFGQVRPEVTIVDTPEAIAIAVGDLNGDGRLDLAFIEAPAKTSQTNAPVFRLHLLIQKNGKFSMPADQTIVLGATVPSGLVIRDFDADGRNDIAVGLRTERSLVLYLGSERLEKEHRSRYTNDSGAGGLSIGRVNRSGLADFLTGAAWRQWQGNDRFGEAFFAGPEWNDNWQSTLADMDRDGLDDIVFTTYRSGKLTAPTNNRIRIYYGPFLKMLVLGPSDASQVVTLNSPFMNTESPVLGQVMVGDLNDDSQLDLVVPARDQTLVYLQNSPTGFSENANPTFVIKEATPLLVTDLNGDKLCDVAFLAANRSGVAVWYQQKGKSLTDKTLAECPRIAIPKMTGVVASGDLDGDARPEIIAAQKGGGLAIVSLPRP
ncbi:MAG: FG-GAP repeat domain-containing protein [Prosthecobacter sp.]